MASGMASRLTVSQYSVKKHQLDFSPKQSSHAPVTLEDYSIIFPPLSIARYSLIQLSELGHCGENENAQSLKR